MKDEGRHYGHDYPLAMIQLRLPDTFVFEAVQLHKLQGVSTKANSRSHSTSTPHIPQDQAALTIYHPYLANCKMTCLTCFPRRRRLTTIVIGRNSHSAPRSC